MIEMMFCHDTRKVVDVWWLLKGRGRREIGSAEWEDALGMATFFELWVVRSWLKKIGAWTSSG